MRLGRGGYLTAGPLTEKKRPAMRRAAAVDVVSLIGALLLNVITEIDVLFEPSDGGFRLTPPQLPNCSRCRACVLFHWRILPSPPPKKKKRIPQHLIRLITKSRRISYRRLNVINIRKVIFFSQLCIVHFFPTSCHLSFKLEIPFDSTNKSIGANY